MRTAATAHAPRATRPSGATRRALVTSLLLLAAPGAGCAGGPAAPEYAPAARLNGTWRWVSSLDVRTNAVHTPAPAGFEATLRFQASGPRTGTFTYARAGQPPVTGRFTIGSEDAPGNDFVVIEPGIDYLARSAWLTVGADSLRLGGVMELGYASSYERVRP